MMSVDHLQGAFFRLSLVVIRVPQGQLSTGFSVKENACSLSLQSQKGCSANKECRRCHCLLIFFTSRASTGVCWLPIFGRHSRL
jgi:hypothetical protein